MRTTDCARRRCMTQTRRSRRALAHHRGSGPRLPSGRECKERQIKWPLLRRVNKRRWHTYSRSHIPVSLRQPNPIAHLPGMHVLVSLPHDTQRATSHAATNQRPIINITIYRLLYYSHQFKWNKISHRQIFHMWYFIYNRSCWNVGICIEKTPRFYSVAFSPVHISTTAIGSDELKTFISKRRRYTDGLHHPQYRNEFDWSAMIENQAVAFNQGHAERGRIRQRNHFIRPSVHIGRYGAGRCVDVDCPVRTGAGFMKHLRLTRLNFLANECILLPALVRK